MKKLLLSFLALVVTMAAMADNSWTKDFAPMSDKKMGSLNAATANDGSVYVSSKVDQAIGSLVTTDKLSTCIIKYDKTGAEKWGVIFEGENTITAMTTDADGNLYVAGIVTGDKITVKGTDSNTSEIINPTEYDPMWDDNVKIANAGFVAKITPEGVFSNLVSFAPAKDAAVAESIDPMYLLLDPLTFTPNNIKVFGDKVYVSATYMGDVAALGWEGAYVSEWGMYFDGYSMGVFSLNKSDLTGAASVFNVQATGLITDKKYEPDALNFFVDDNNFTVCFFGAGNLTMKTATDSKDITGLYYDSDADGVEHAFVAANIKGDAIDYKLFRAAPIQNETLRMFDICTSGDVVDGNAVFAGSYFGQLALNNEKPVVTAPAAFAASVKLSDNTVNWVETPEAATATLCSSATESMIQFATLNKMYAYKMDGTALDPTDITGKVMADMSNGSKMFVQVYTMDDATDMNVYVQGQEIESAPADVTDSETWDWSNATGDGAELPADMKNVNILLSDAPGFVPGTGFSADKLVINGQYAWRDANNSKLAQVNSIWFNTTVAGKVVVEYANTGNNAARTVVVNSTTDTGEAVNNKDYVTSQEVAVEAGPVLISGKEVESGDAKMLRIRKVTFTATPSAVVEVKGAAGAQAAAVKKYFKDGKLIIEGADGSKFNAAGVQIK